MGLSVGTDLLSLILCTWHGPVSAIYGAPPAISLTVLHAGGGNLPA
jgi:hypothetical protein